MARLIVDEGGKSRRFKLGEGKLTLGSGEACMLKLGAADVAAEHAEIECRDGKAILRLRAGVRPARVRGREVAGELSMEHNVPVKLGGVTLTVEYEQAAQTKAAATKALVERRPRQRSKSVPTWLIYSFIGAGLIVAFFVLKNANEKSKEVGFSAAASLAKIERAHEAGDYIMAQKELDIVAAHSAEVPAELRARIDQIQKGIQASVASAEAVNENSFGNDYVQTQIRDFEKNHVKKSMDKAYIRVLLKRCEYFRKTWPSHPDLEEVKQKELRYAEVVRLADPPTFADVEVEVKTLTWAKPREYRQCFTILENYLNAANADDKAKCLELIDAKRKEMAEHFEDRMQQAKYEWEKGQEGKSVGELVSIIIRFDDDEMENRAASELVRLPGILAFLEGYKRERPSHWKLLLENTVVSGKAQELGLL